MLGGGAITWSSKKQTTVATSTAEAEYMASASAAREAMWLKNLFEELGYKQIKPTTLYEDNNAAIKIGRDSQFHQRSKHFDIKYHYVREKENAGEIVITECTSEDMIADIFTKPLAKPRHEKLTRLLGMPIGLRGSVED